MEVGQDCPLVKLGQELETAGEYFVGVLKATELEGFELKHEVVRLLHVRKGQL
jgi:hypothetical protein